MFTTFILQAATGVVKTFGHVPGRSRAFLSVAKLTYTQKNGWLIRSMHRWTASFMVLNLILHVSPPYMFTGCTLLAGLRRRES